MVDNTSNQQPRPSGSTPIGRETMAGESLMIEPRVKAAMRDLASKLSVDGKRVSKNHLYREGALLVLAKHGITLDP